MHKLNLLQVAVILAFSMIANAQETAAKPNNLTQRVAHEIVAFDYHDIPPEVIEKSAGGLAGVEASLGSGLVFGVQRNLPLILWRRKESH